MRNAILLGLGILLVGSATTRWLIQGESPAPAPADTTVTAETRTPANVSPARSPADVVTLLQTLHTRRAYDQIASLIVADRRETSLALLRAIDEVLDANKSLRHTAEEAYSGPITETWDLASMADNLGPFSEHVQLIRQQFKGGRATVTLQAGDNIPLIHAEFELVSGTWQYRPEPSPARLTTELLALARTLRSVEESVQHGAPFESYYDSFLYRVLPQMARVVTAKDEEGGAIAAADE